MTAAKRLPTLMVEGEAFWLQPRSCQRQTLSDMLYRSLYCKTVGQTVEPLWTIGARLLPASWP